MDRTAGGGLSLVGGSLTGLGRAVELAGLFVPTRLLRRLLPATGFSCRLDYDRKSQGKAIDVRGHRVYPYGKRNQNFDGLLEAVSSICRKRPDIENNIMFTQEAGE